MRITSSAIVLALLLIPGAASAQAPEVLQPGPETRPASPKTEAGGPAPKAPAGSLGEVPVPEAQGEEPEAPAQPGAPTPPSSPDPEPEDAATPEPAQVEPEKASAKETAPEEEPADAPEEEALEKPMVHQGHYIALGAHGLVGLVYDADRGRRGPALGQGYSLRLGEKVTSWLDLGLAFAYARVGGDEPWTFGRLTVHGQAYFRPEYFVHAGFGFGVAGGTDPEDPKFDRGRFGDVYTAGAGMNIDLSDSKKSGGWMLTPTITAEYSRDDVFPNSALWIGVEITRWWGVARNQLDLDFDEAYKRR